MDEREEIERALADSLAEDDDEGVMPARALVTGLGPGVHDIDMASYLADPCVTPSMRSSDIQRMLRLRPAHVKAFHPRLCEPSQREWAIRRATKRMDLGNVIHALVLGNGSKFCVIDPSDFNDAKGKPLKGSGNEHKAEVRAAKERGLIVLSRAENIKAQRSTDRLKAKLGEEFADFGGWPFGEVERTLVWTEQTEHGPVMCRTRPDILAHAHGLEVDVKTTAAGLSDDDLSRSMSADGGGIFIQAAWQKRGMLANFPELAKRDRDATHMHAFCETEPPFEPRLVRASLVALEMAERRCLRAVNEFAACMASGEWWGWEPTTGMPSSWLEKLWLEDEGEIEA